MILTLAQFARGRVGTTGYNWIIKIRLSRVFHGARQISYRLVSIRTNKLV